MFRTIQAGLLWVAKRCAEAIRWVAKKLEKAAERVEKIVESAVEIMEEVVDRVSETPVAKAVVAGYEKVDKFFKATELFARLDRMTMWVVAFVLGQSCSTLTTASWTPAICAGLYSITFIAMLAGSVFAFYMIGQLIQLRL